MTKHAALIIGASGGLGSALRSRFEKDTDINHVISVSRDNEYPASHKGSNSHHIQCDYTESSIMKASSQIKALLREHDDLAITRVCICNGILHNDKLWPEKRLEDISTEAMLEVFTTNSIVPILWLRFLVSILKGSTSCIVAVFSARIGSIGDNISGGWYSYRASKSALNMLLKSAAIEYARRAGNVKLLAFHPGTTDTNLSKPFQSRIKPGKLFTPEFVATQLTEIMNTAVVDGELSFIDWDNNPIVW